jgi:hypothetical protein
VALGIALLALVFAAQPVGAVSWGPPHGTTAWPDVTVGDEQADPGIACRYEDNAGQLDDVLDVIRIRQLWSHGPFATKSYVGFRYVIARNSPPYDDNDYVKVYQSPIVKKKANQTEVAFYSATWHAPEHTNAQYRVRLFIYWYAKNDPSRRIGWIKGVFEAYEHIHPVDGPPYTIGDTGNTGYCRPEFH